MVTGIGIGAAPAVSLPRGATKASEKSGPDDKAGVAAARLAETLDASLAAKRAALEKLRAPRERSEAENRLDQLLQSMKNAGQADKLEAARRKLEQLKARVKALELAAASAAARGDARAAKAIAREIKQLARDMAGALRDAGQGGGAGGGQVGQVAPAQQADAATQQQQDLAVRDAVGGSLGDGRAVDATARAAAAIKGADIGNAQPAGNTASIKEQLEQLKQEVRAQLEKMKKILTQARAALLNPLADPEERRKAEKAFGEADQAMAGLEAAAAPDASVSMAAGLGGGLGGGGIDLQA